MTDLTERLRECPFCGGEATIVVSDLRPCNVDGWTDGYSVFCRESVRCSGRLPKFHKTRVEAIAAWNKRPTLETLTQENARLREAGWRDIESAPSDGTEVLGWRDDCGALLMRWTSPAEFLTDAELAEWSEDDAHSEAWFYADFLQGGRLNGDEEPTHWMPLPPAPARKALGGGDE